MIESKSQADMKEFTPPQQAVMTIYLSEIHDVQEQEHIMVLDAYLQRQGLSEKQSVMESRIIVEQAKDPGMHWGIETGYNSTMYWHKDEDTNATKALARLLKTTR